MNDCYLINYKINSDYNSKEIRKNFIHSSSLLTKFCMANYDVKIFRFLYDNFFNLYKEPISDYISMILFKNETTNKLFDNSILIKMIVELVFNLYISFDFKNKYFKDYKTFIMNYNYKFYNSSQKFILDVNLFIEKVLFKLHNIDFTIGDKKYDRITFTFEILNYFLSKLFDNDQTICNQINDDEINKIEKYLGYTNLEFVSLCKNAVKSYDIDSRSLIENTTHEINKKENLNVKNNHIINQLGFFQSFIRVLFLTTPAIMYDFSLYDSCKLYDNKYKINLIIKSFTFACLYNLFSSVSTNKNYIKVILFLSKSILSLYMLNLNFYTNYVVHNSYKCNYHRNKFIPSNNFALSLLSCYSLFNFVFLIYNDVFDRYDVNRSYF